MERQSILTTIAQLNDDKLLAARLLGIRKTTLYQALGVWRAGLGTEPAVDMRNKLGIAADDQAFECCELG